MSELPFAVAPVLGQLASTGITGVPLQNGTPTFLSWTAPADGQMHRVLIFVSLEVISAETGGQINQAYTNPWGSSVNSQLLAGGLSGSTATFAEHLVAPGSTVSVAQSTALTGGTASLWAEIWGS